MNQGLEIMPNGCRKLIPMKFLPGQIVSVKKGFIQKELNSSDKLLVISSKPIVLGNAPDHSEHGKYERVAFGSNSSACHRKSQCW